MQEVENIIKQLAFKYSKYAEKKGIMVNDLLQVGYVGYLEGIEDYDETKGMSRTSYIYFIVRNKLDRFCNTGMYHNYVIDKVDRTETNEEKKDNTINLNANVYLKEVNEEINKLSNKEKKILHYKALEYSDNEIAKKVKSTKRTVCYVKNKSIKTIKERLNEEN